MARLTELRPQYVEYIPEQLEEGILYISKRFGLAIHLCACGCKVKTVTPIADADDWQLTEYNGCGYAQLGDAKYKLIKLHE